MPTVEAVWIPGRGLVVRDRHVCACKQRRERVQARVEALNGQEHRAVWDEVAADDDAQIRPVRRRSPPELDRAGTSGASGGAERSIDGAGRGAHAGRINASHVAAATGEPDRLSRGMCARMKRTLSRW